MLRMGLGSATASMPIRSPVVRRVEPLPHDDDGGDATKAAAFLTWLRENGARFDRICWPSYDTVRVLVCLRLNSTPIVVQILNY